MYYGNDKIRTFTEIQFWDFEKQKIREITNEIDGKGKDYILKVDEQEFKDYLFQKYYIEPIKIDLENEIIEEPIPIKETVTDRLMGEKYETDVYYITVKYPFQGNSDIFRIRPTSFTLTSGEISIRNSFVAIEVRMIEKKLEEFIRRKNEIKRNAFANLQNANNDINGYNNKLKGHINSVFNQYKEKYLKENDFFVAIKAKINKDTESVFSAPTIKKRIIPQPTISNQKEFSSEPVMSNEMYLDVLKVIYDSGKNMEKKPALYVGKDEEGLRDQFLFVLETRYVGITATGETFNRGGKTDILLKYSNDGSNLFVGECKFWHGAKEFLNAISQLFDR